MFKARAILISSIITGTLFLTGCGDPAAQSTTDATNATKASSPSWILTAAPENATSITDAKASAKEGDEIVLRGRIGGRKEPIGEGSPVFTMMDLAIPHCGQNPDDRCATPWDYCCETPETIATNSATVQVLDASGQSETTSLIASGLSALDEILVVGTVGPRPNDQVLTIRATGIYRVE